MVTALKTESTRNMRHQVSPALYLTFSLLWFCEDGTDKLSRNVGKELNYVQRNSPEECSSNSYLFCNSVTFFLAYILYGQEADIFSVTSSDTYPKDCVVKA